jgi:aryl-alcohol dehydrogenase-like predicted oxidoreductase
MRLLPVEVPCGGRQPSPCTRTADVRCRRGRAEGRSTCTTGACVAADARSARSRWDDDFRCGNQRNRLARAARRLRRGGAARWVDTADVYAGGVSEETSGAGLPPGRRTYGPGSCSRRGSLPDGARNPTRAVRPPPPAPRPRRLLSRLGVDHVDLYQLHAWDPHTPIEESLRFLDDAIHAGKISYAGLSNFTGWQVQKTVDVAERHHLAVPVTLQPAYSLLVREIEWEIVPACLENGLGMLPWSPLGGGWLSGKYQRDQRPEGPPARGGSGARDRGVRPAGRCRADSGTPSTRADRPPTVAASRWPRWRWPGCATAPRSAR